MAIVVPAAQKGFLTPKRSWDFPPKETWSDGWMGSLQADVNQDLGQLVDNQLKAGQKEE